MTRRLQARHHGEPEDVLKLVEVPEDPPPGPGEVTLTVAAVGLNYLDVSLCRGEYTASSALPATPGVEAAGHVVRAGPGAEHLIGHEVLACPTFPRGALGDEVTVDAALVIDRPSGMSATVAAALPVTYQTAWFALERARVTAGDTVLIHAGAGGVGIAATQLAVARGAESWPRRAPRPNANCVSPRAQIKPWPMTRSTLCGASSTSLWTRSGDHCSAGPCPA